MAGTFKKFIGGLTAESIQTATANCDTSQQVNVIPYKSTDGTARTTVYFQASATAGSKQTAKMFSPYYWLTPVATADTLENYSLDDYQVSGVGTTTYSRSQTINSTGATLIYSITVTAGSEDITVNCIKFKKPFIISSGTTADVLVCGYYLENPVTVTAGTSQTINVAFTVGEMSTVS